MLHARILYIAALLGALLFHTYYTGWFSWYLLMLAVILPWFSLLCSLRPMLRLRLQADMPSRLPSWRACLSADGLRGKASPFAAVPV